MVSSLRLMTNTLKKLSDTSLMGVPSCSQV